MGGRRIVLSYAAPPAGPLLWDGMGWNGWESKEQEEVGSENIYLAHAAACSLCEAVSLVSRLEDWTHSGAIWPRHRAYIWGPAHAPQPTTQPTAPPPRSLGEAAWGKRHSSARRRWNGRRGEEEEGRGNVGPRSHAVTRMLIQRSLMGGGATPGA